MCNKIRLSICFIIAILATFTLFWYLGNYTNNYCDEEIEIRKLIGRSTEPPLKEWQRLFISVIFFIILLPWFYFVFPKLHIITKK